MPITATKPSTNAMLAILDPATFPITIFDSPISTASIDDANSGKEVPKAMIVTPIIKGGIPIDKPIFSAASTK